jgi:hypothetical protein
MARTNDDIHTRPDDLPVPENGGQADDLLDAVVPPIAPRTAPGETVRPDDPPQELPPDSHAAEVLSWLRV